MIVKRNLVEIAQVTTLFIQKFTLVAHTMKHAQSNLYEHLFKLGVRPL
jgi:hypothetical protein